MFTDEAIINAIGGHGGAGMVGWRREKYVAKGGPNGGDGGDGGSIFLIADPNTDTLSSFLSRKKYKAESGESGMRQNMHGKNGEDLHLAVPPGTLVYDCTEGKDFLIADLEATGDQVLIAKGGRGGYGNAHFKSSVRQRPDFAELGEPGEERSIRLELKLVADVGIIGFPSVGKSTLISVISAARPKIAAYEFTTLVPNLGVVTVGERSYVVCDVPGLIEGASEGKGLGHQFLKHIERCGVLLHVLDIERSLVDGIPDTQKLQQDYAVIRKELEAYSPALAQKKEFIILNKSDLYDDDFDVPGLEVFARISAASRRGTDDLAKKLLPIVLEEREKRRELEQRESDDLPVLRPQDVGEKMGAYRITEDEDGTMRISGKRLEQFMSMVDFSSESAVRRFRDVCERIGIVKAARKRKAGANVYIGEKDVTELL